MRSTTHAGTSSTTTTRASSRPAPTARRGTTCAVPAASWARASACRPRAAISTRAHAGAGAPNGPTCPPTLGLPARRCGCASGCAAMATRTSMDSRSTRCACCCSIPPHNPRWSRWDRRRRKGRSSCRTPGPIPRTAARASSLRCLRAVRRRSKCSTCRAAWCAHSALARSRPAATRGSGT